MDQIKFTAWVLPLIAIDIEHSIIKEDQFLAIFHVSINFFGSVILELGVAYGLLNMSEGKLVSYAIYTF